MSKFSAAQLKEFNAIYDGWIQLMVKELKYDKVAMLEVMKEHDRNYAADIDCADYARQAFLYWLNKFYQREKLEYENMADLTREAQDILNGTVED